MRSQSQRHRGISAIPYRYFPKTTKKREKNLARYETSPCSFLDANRIWIFADLLQFAPNGFKQSCSVPGLPVPSLDPVLACSLPKSKQDVGFPYWWLSYPSQKYILKRLESMRFGIIEATFPQKWSQFGSSKDLHARNGTTDFWNTDQSRWWLAIPKPQKFHSPNGLV